MRKPAKQSSLKKTLLLALLLPVPFLAMSAVMWFTIETPEGPRFLAGGRLTTIEHHQRLLAALAAGELTPVPNSVGTPRLPHGPDWADIEPGEDMVLVQDSVFDIEGATNAAQTSSLRLVLPAAVWRDSMTLDFHDGQTADGVLLFVSNTNHAWNRTIIGYPVAGMVRLNRTGKSGIDAEFDVEYRCVRYVFRGDAGQPVHGGWEEAAGNECPQTLFPRRLHFKQVRILGIHSTPEALRYRETGS